MRMSQPLDLFIRSATEPVEKRAKYFSFVVVNGEAGDGI
jgi:hypothetical protein